MYTLLSIKQLLIVSVFISSILLEGSSSLPEEPKPFDQQEYDRKNPLVAPFCRQKLKERGLPEYATILLGDAAALRTDGYNHWCTGYDKKGRRYIGMPGFVQEALVSGKPKTINYMIGTLDHEATHIIEEHIEQIKFVRRNLRKSAAFLYTGAGCLYFAQDLHRSQSYLSTVGFFVGLGIILNLEYYCFYNAFNRGLEKDADNGVRNDVPCLEARALWFMQEHKKSQERLRYSWKNLRLGMFWQALRNLRVDLANTNPVANFFLADHPLHRVRAQDFQRRADALKQEQQLEKNKKIRKKLKDVGYQITRPSERKKMSHAQKYTIYKAWKLVGKGI